MLFVVVVASINIPKTRGQKDDEIKNFINTLLFMDDLESTDTTSNIGIINEEFTVPDGEKITGDSTAESEQHSSPCPADTDDVVGITFCGIITFG